MYNLHAEYHGIYWQEFGNCRGCSCHLHLLCSFPGTDSLFWICLSLLQWRMNGQINYMLLEVLFGKYSELDICVFFVLQITMLYFNLMISFPDGRTPFFP